MRSVMKLAVLVVAATSLGAMCTPPDTVRIEIRRPGVSFWQRDITRRTTHGWMEDGLWPIVTALSPTAPTTLTVNEPGDALELFVLNRGPLWSPTVPMPKVDPSTRFASHRSATTFTTNIGMTEDILAARLVDHGGCAKITPWIQGPNKDNIFGPPTADTRGIFRDLDDGITAAFRAKAGVIAVVKVLDVFQASFTKEDGVSVYNTVDVDDGFAMHVQFSFAARLDVQPYQVANVSIDARYRIRRRNGLPFVEVIGNPRVSVIGTAIASFLKSSELRAQFASEVPATMNATILSQATQVPILFSTCDARPGAGGDATCASAINRGIMIDTLGKRVGDKPKVAAIVPSLSSEGFVCLPVGSDPEIGQCWWHPVFERVNVLPQGIETVWDNAGSAASPDRQLITLLAPNQGVQIQSG